MTPATHAANPVSLEARANTAMPDLAHPHIHAPEPGNTARLIHDLRELFKVKVVGLVLVTGPTGSGKSTTLACLINRINEKRKDHILTIEDPIEFVYENKNSVIRQRELVAAAGK